MTLLRLHRVFIVASLLLCIVFAGRELALASTRSVPRVLLGVGAPALLGGVLAAYWRYLNRRIAVMTAEAAQRSA